MPSELARLRKSLRKARVEFSTQDKDCAAIALCRRVSNTPAFRASDTVALYVPMSDEIDISELFAKAWLASKNVVLPVVQESQLFFAPYSAGDPMEKNRFGIPEPTTQDGFVSPHQIDLVVTPLLGFDEQCHRIGMGGGFYDRTFKFLRNRRHWFRPKLLGVGFECQKVRRINPQPWDVSMWCIATEKTIYRHSK